MMASGGGALICHDDKDAKKVLCYATQSRENRPYYCHEEVGYNYRLRNISAAIGCAQADVLPKFVARRRAIHALYDELLQDIPEVQLKDNPNEHVNSNFWLSTILIDESTSLTPEQIRVAMNEANIETRWLWRPMHMQPIYKNAPYYGKNFSEIFFNKGLCLPSGSVMTDDDVVRVVDTLKKIMKK